MALKAMNQSNTHWIHNTNSIYGSFSNWRTIPVQDIKSDLVFDIYDNFTQPNFRVNIDMSF